MKRPALLPLAMAVTLLSACAPADRAPPAATPQTVEAPKPPPKPKITAEQLLGQTDSWLLKMMGEPAFRRTDRHANLWQYKNGACVLNVFLYAEAQTTATDAAPRVMHFDARTLEGGNADRGQCLSALQD